MTQAMLMQNSGNAGTGTVFILAVGSVLLAVGIGFVLFRNKRK